MINDDKVYGSIRKSIQKLRESHPENGKKVTQQTLADAIGITRATLTNIELGNQRASVNVIYRICDYFDVSLEDVMPKISEVKEDIEHLPIDVDAAKSSLPEQVSALVDKARLS